ncbi:MAG: thioredoxin-disulfide reductase [Candidatus Marsarchaeota archaeon]|nr:thioredoxin-disulfide reductase [Candidatus Marsarchaeota archaeon]
MAEKVIIIGSGPAGLSAAIYTAREGFEPVVVGGYASGGQLMLTTVVENIPGFPEGITGPEFVQQLRKQAEKFGTRFIDKDVTKVDLKSKPIKVSIEDKEYETQTLVIATGANAKMLGLESEKRFMGRGVSTCGTCDGPFFKGKDVIVIGGGDTAMEDSLFLTRFAKSVTIVHRRDSFRASKIMQERVMSNPKIKVVWNTTLQEIKGEKSVSSAVLKDEKSGQTSEMPIQGVFIAIGYQPNTKLFDGQLETNDQGYLVTKDEIRTDIEGVYVAGDVADHIYRQAGTAAGSGIKAALCVRAFIAEHEAKP